MEKNHPKLIFLFYYSDAFEEKDVVLMRELVEEISSSRRWVIGPPRFIDETEPDVQNDEDCPIRTVGGVLKIYSALPPWGDALPRELDEAHYEEVEAIVTALCELSNHTGAQIGLELGGDQVGWIQNGIPDTGISLVLLGEWKKGLEA